MFYLLVAQLLLTMESVHFAVTFSETTTYHRLDTQRGHTIRYCM